MRISNVAGLVMVLSLSAGCGGVPAPEAPDEVRAVAAVLEFLTEEGLNHAWGEPPPGRELRERLPFRVAPVYLSEGRARLVEGRSLGRDATLRNVTDEILASGAEIAADGPAVLTRDCTEQGCIGQAFAFLPTEVLAVERPNAMSGELELTASFIQVHWSEGDPVSTVGATTA